MVSEGTNWYYRIIWHERTSINYEYSGIKWQNLGKINDNMFSEMKPKIVAAKANDTIKGKK